jgi:hypothetical protein
MDTLTFYVIRNSEGKYLRAKGYNGSDECWVELKNAKVYIKQGVAQGQITWWSNNYPKFPTPELIPLVAVAGEPIDQTARLAKAKKAKEKYELKRAISTAEYELKAAQKEVDRLKNDNPTLRLEKAQSKLQNIQNKLKGLK